MAKDTGGLIRNIDIRQIVELVEAFDRSNLDLLQFDSGHFRLTLGKGGAGAIPDLSTVAPMRPISGSPASSETIQAPPPATKAADTISPRTNTAGDTVDVHAPIMGLFYPKPDPSSPPFVTIGSEVQEGTTVGLIEVMKVFNAVQAGTKGTIAEICVENGQTVEIGQTLFRIRPNVK